LLQAEKEDINIAKKFTVRLHYSVLTFIAWMIICTILMTLPGSAFPSKNWMADIQLDKWIHIFLFGVMAVALCWAIYKNNHKHSSSNLVYFIIAGIICLAYGIMMEFMQKNYIPNRSFDTGDIIADAVGSFIGTGFSYYRYIKK
jgi:VanZ family protein